MPHIPNRLRPAGPRTGPGVRAASAAVFAAGVLLLAGCSHHDKPAPGPTGTTVTPSHATPTPTHRPTTRPPTTPPISVTPTPTQPTSTPTDTAPPPTGSGN